MPFIICDGIPHVPVNIGKTKKSHKDKNGQGNRKGGPSCFFILFFHNWAALSPWVYPGGRFYYGGMAPKSMQKSDANIIYSPFGCSHDFSL
jgi:hypothetical protein